MQNTYQYTSLKTRPQSNTTNQNYQIQSTITEVSKIRRNTQTYI